MIDRPALDTLQTLLNLAEFMERDGHPLPIDVRVLGSVAEKCHAYAKALHYKEMEFTTNPQHTIEALISINNQLQQPEAAVGVLTYAKENHSLEVKESWYEKLQRWEDALDAYERRQLRDPNDHEVTLGRLRCMRALGDWERLSQLAGRLWDTSGTESANIRSKVAPLAAYAAWNMRKWTRMEKYVNAMEHGVAEGEFFRAILAAHHSQFDAAEHHIAQTRQLLDGELTALVGESYNRAYRVVVQAQQLSELEEVLMYKRTTSPAAKQRIRDMWSQRLKGCQRDVDVWQQLLAVRSVVVSPQEDIPTWLKFSSLCRKSGRVGLSLKVLTELLEVDSPVAASDSKEPMYRSRQQSVVVPDDNPLVRVFVSLLFLFCVSFVLLLFLCCLTRSASHIIPHSSSHVVAGYICLSQASVGGWLSGTL